jgi:hypothetical protein
LYSYKHFLPHQTPRPVAIMQARAFRLAALIALVALATAVEGALRVF